VIVHHVSPAEILPEPESVELLESCKETSSAAPAANASGTG